MKLLATDICGIVITQVFPDEFHLNTLDQLLSAISQLNPHVNIKAIVIGLMDRLSSYAARESELESSEDREKNEQEATIRLLERLKIAKERKPETKAVDDTSEAVNGEHANGDKPADSPKSDARKEPNEETKPSTEPTDQAVEAADEAPSKKKRGIPDNVKLYEIFYDQVTNLVNAQRLHIQDTIALLVSLTNLALFVFLAPRCLPRS